MTPYAFDPELAPFAARLPARDLRDLAAARAPRAPNPAATPDDVEVHDEVLGGPGPLTVRVFRPRPARGGSPPVPGVLRLHAGGFVLGSIDADHDRSARLCQELGAVVVSVAYRLAPEAPYPAALEDCYLALRWLYDQAGALGVDADRVAVHGHSAGGGLAAATALFARDHGGPPIRFLYLGMPQVDDRLTASKQRFTDTPLWNRESAELSWQLYLGDRPAGPAGPAGVDAYAAPARAADLSGLPPAYVSAMEFDPLRDEALVFARALLAAGVPAEVHLFPGTFHGSAGVVPDAAISVRERAEEYAVLRRALSDC
jgi:acetyl esterase/lipase